MYLRKGVSWLNHYSFSLSFLLFILFSFSSSCLLPGLGSLSVDAPNLVLSFFNQSPLVPSVGSCTLLQIHGNPWFYPPVLLSHLLDQLGPTALSFHSFSALFYTIFQISYFFVHFIDFAFCSSLPLVSIPLSRRIIWLTLSICPTNRCVLSFSINPALFLPIEVLLHNWTWCV